MKNVLIGISFVLAINSNAQTALSLFDKSKMEYKGGKTEQAELLLRKVNIQGNIDIKKPEIDKQFLTLLDGNLDITKTTLRKYLAENKIHENEVGGSIDDPISSIILNGDKVYAKYFVIHDVSTPSYENKFPNNINDSTWKKNNVNSWTWKKGEEPSHIIVTRTGNSKTIYNFSTGWRATRFENDKYGLGKVSRGLFLHIELVQPRVFTPPSSNEENAPFAPVPGFTDKQYEQLALLYICASIRKGEWLIPAFHGCIDEGIKGGHDDPQNFELNKFTTAVLNIVTKIKIS